MRLTSARPSAARILLPQLAQRTQRPLRPAVERDEPERPEEGREVVREPAPVAVIGPAPHHAAADLRPVAHGLPHRRHVGGLEVLAEPGVTAAAGDADGTEL